jgi:hypothetical protein
VRPDLKIFDRGMVIEVETRRMSEEGRVWFRFDERERAEKRDGLSLGVVGPRVRLGEWYLKHGDPRRWFTKTSNNAFLKGFRAGLASAEGLLFLKTATNTQEDWIKAGRGYVRASLAATGLGLQMHPYSQVLQEYPENTELQREFNNLMGVSGEENTDGCSRWKGTDALLQLPSKRGVARDVIDEAVKTGGDMFIGDRRCARAVTPSAFRNVAEPPTCRNSVT